MTNQSNAKSWKPFVTESRQITNGEIGAGAQFIEGIDVLNRHWSGIVEILEDQPYHWSADRTREEPDPFSLFAQMSLEETSAGYSYCAWSLAAVDMPPTQPRSAHRGATVFDVESISGKGRQDCLGVRAACPADDRRRKNREESSLNSMVLPWQTCS